MDIQSYDITGGIDMFTTSNEIRKIDNIIQLSISSSVKDEINLNNFDYNQLKYAEITDGVNIMNNKTVIVDNTTVAVDTRKIFKDDATNIVNKYFLNNEIRLHNFLGLITRIFNLAIHRYCLREQVDERNIFFVYKGGNVLRLQYIKFVEELNLVTKDKQNPSFLHVMSILDKYKDFFTRSDLDFSIYINPALPQYESHLNNMTHLAYHAQRLIIQTITSNDERKKHYLGIFADVANQYALLNELLNNLNLSVAKVNSESEYYGGKFTATGFYDKVYKPDNEIPLIINSNKSFTQHDSLVNSVYEDKGHYRKYDGLNEDYASNFDHVKTFVSTIASSTGTDFPTSINNTLTFLKDNHLVSFILVRTKVNFHTLFVSKFNKLNDMNISGELIDVSIPLKNDYEIIKFFNNTKQYITNYEINLYGNAINFKSLTYKYMIDDIHKILFDIKFPWGDPKYKKRLYRLIIMHTIAKLRFDHSRLCVRMNDIILNIEQKWNIIETFMLNKTSDLTLFDLIEEKDSYDNILNSLIIVYNKFVLLTPDEQMDTMDKIKEFTEFNISILNEMKVICDYVNDSHITLSSLNEVYKSYLQYGGLSYALKYAKYKNKYLRLKFEMNK